MQGFRSFLSLAGGCGVLLGLVTLLNAGSLRLKANEPSSNESSESLWTQMNMVVNEVISETGKPRSQSSAKIKGKEGKPQEQAEKTD